MLNSLTRMFLINKLFNHVKLPSDLASVTNYGNECSSLEGTEMTKIEVEHIWSAVEGFYSSVCIGSHRPRTREKLRSTYLSGSLNTSIRRTSSSSERNFMSSQFLDSSEDSLPTLSRYTDGVTPVACLNVLAKYWLLE